MGVMLLSDQDVDDIVKELNKQLDEAEDGLNILEVPIKNYTAFAEVDVINSYEDLYHTIDGYVSKESCYKTSNNTLKEFWIEDDNGEIMDFREPEFIKTLIGNLIK